MRPVHIIGVPLDLGGNRRGVDMGPSAFRLADIHQKVRELGYEVADAGDMEVSIQETREPGDPRMKFLKEIRSTCEALREKVVEVLGQGGMPVVLGGDHSIAMGTIGGVSRFHHERGEKVGLVWFDAHGDMNTPDTSPSGNIHGMPLAVALGLGDPGLCGLAGSVPMVDAARAAVVALRDVDLELVARHGTDAVRFTMTALGAPGTNPALSEQRLAGYRAFVNKLWNVGRLPPVMSPG